MTPDINGYSADIPYLRDFKPMLAPAWLDHVALVAGVVPPDRRDGFAWCDLGCGQGVTAAILAATHPTGAFHGIDAMPVHVGHARRLASEAAIANVHFHAIDFAAALHAASPQFDYIVAHGVYTWIDPASQHALRQFVDRHLKPGGLVYLGYNAMPGWGRDLPFQRLIQELAATFSGDSAERFAHAAEIARALAGAAVPALAASSTLRELHERPADYAPAYLVHEFMPAAWRPLYVTEVRAAMAAIGLEPVGSATLNENIDRMVLDKRARAMLAGIPDAGARELVRDYYLDQRFRRDVFARGNRRLGPGERTERLLSSSFGLARPRPAIRYSATTPAGPLAYEGPAARAIIAALARGPRPITGMTEDPEIVVTLCAAGDIMPVERGDAGVGDLNRLLCGRVDGPEEIGWLALPCGTALKADRALLRAIRDGQAIDERRFPGWRGLLAGYGL